MGRTIALYQEGFGASGWEYYVHGTEREARVLPTTAQTPGSNTTLTNETLMQVGLDYATFYVSDHLGNTRVTYTPKGSYYAGFVALSDDFNGTSLDGWAGNESTLSNTSGLLQVDIPAYAVEQYIYKALNEPLVANQGYTFSVTVTGTNIVCEIDGIEYSLANGANSFNFTPTSTVQNPEIRFRVHGGNGQPTALNYKLDKMSLTYDVLYSENRIDYVGDYFPYGKILREFVNADRERYLTTQHERDAETGLDYRGARYYDADIARFLSLDPLAKDFASWSPYNYVMGNPIVFVDPDGKEPIKPLAGTAFEFMVMLYNSPSGVGYYTGKKALDYVSNLDNVDWAYNPTETGYFNLKKGRYIYTEKGGWIDMVHFMFYFGAAYSYRLSGESNPIGEAVQDGFQQEASDGYFAPHSAYSYEDLPSDKYGADFAVNYYSAYSDEDLASQIANYLIGVLGATNPENAPNYSSLPTEDLTCVPTRTNRTTNPLFIEGDDGTSGNTHRDEQIKPKSLVTTCFVAGTKVKMSDESSMNIEDIKCGDQILSFNFETMSIVIDTVLSIPDSIKVYQKIEMTLSDSSQIEFSPAHPFWVVGKGWSVFDIEEAKTELEFSVSKMEVGDNILKLNSGILEELTIIEIKNTYEEVKMYNVEFVKNTNNFFANNILVHNKGLRK